MAKRPRKITYKEALVLGDDSGKLTYVFLSENGFLIKEPEKYAPKTRNVVNFTDKAGAPIAFHAITNYMEKIKPAMTQVVHKDTYLYYFKGQYAAAAAKDKKDAFKLYQFKLLGGVPGSNVMYNDVTMKYVRDAKSMYYHKAKDRNYVSSINAMVMDKPEELGKEKMPANVKNFVTNKDRAAPAPVAAPAPAPAAPVPAAPVPAPVAAPAGPSVPAPKTVAPNRANLYDDIANMLRTKSPSPAKDPILNILNLASDMYIELVQPDNLVVNESYTFPKRTETETVTDLSQYQGPTYVA
jgi:hypothetical protein